MGKKAHYRHEPLVDLYSDEAALAVELLEPLGMGPMLPDPVKRPPYDELFVKLKRQRDYWNPES